MENKIDLLNNLQKDWVESFLITSAPEEYFGGDRNYLKRIQKRLLTKFKSDSHPVMHLTTKQKDWVEYSLLMTTEDSVPMPEDIEIIKQIHKVLNVAK